MNHIRDVLGGSVLRTMLNSVLFMVPVEISTLIISFIISFVSDDSDDDGITERSYRVDRFQVKVYPF